MYIKTVRHLFPYGLNAKITIRDRLIENERYFYANIINVELDEYKNLSEIEKEAFYGIEITDGKQQSINYRDPDKLIQDVITLYGNSKLETECYQ